MGKEVGNLAKGTVIALQSWAKSTTRLPNLALIHKVLSDLQK